MRRRDAALIQVQIKVKRLTKKKGMRMVVMLREGTACARGLALRMLVEIATNKVAEEGALRPRCCCEALRCLWLASSCRALRALRGLRGAQRALRGMLRALRVALRALLGTLNGLGEDITMDIEALMLPHSAPIHRVDPLELLLESMEPLESMKLLLVPLELVEPLELTERTSLLLLEKHPGEQRLRSKWILQQVRSKWILAKLSSSCLKLREALCVHARP